MPKGAKPKNITHCIDCGMDLNIDPVYKSNYRQSRCRECLNKRFCGRYKEYQTEFRNRPESKLRKKELQLERTFGISKEDYNKLLEFQSGVCAICKQKPEDRDLDVDHNHSTGEVRGLLCQKCNPALGSFMEDPEIILNAYDYLMNTTWNRGLDLVQIRKKI